MIAKTFEKIRALIIADSDLLDIVGLRVYSSHISLIEGVVYPAISLFLLNSSAVPSCPEMEDMTIQIDIWMPASSRNKSDIYTCASLIRTLLHRQKITDARITFVKCLEVSRGPEMFEEDTQLYHLPLRYEVMAHGN